MRINVRYQRFKPVEQKDLEQLINSWAQRYLEPRLNKVGFSAAELVAVVSKRATGSNHYAVKLRMHVPPKKVLVARGEADQIKPAIDTALDRLLCEVERHIARVGQQESHKRNARRARLRRLNKHNATLPTDLTGTVTASIETLLPGLERAVERELVYLRSQGDLAIDYPTVQDIVDEVIASATANWKPGLHRNSAYILLLREMHKVLEHEVKTGQVFGAMESLQDVPAEDAFDQSEAMVGATFHEFWQPDESLRLEDVIADDNAIDPEESGEDEQQFNYLLRLLQDLPILWRRALMLFELEHMTLQDLAYMLDADQATVASWIDQANRLLRARLQDAGFLVNGTNPLAALRNGQPREGACVTKMTK